jgi:hypothetical protein
MALELMEAEGRKHALGKGHELYVGRALVSPSVFLCGEDEEDDVDGRMLVMVVWW